LGEFESGTMPWAVSRVFLSPVYRYTQPLEDHFNQPFEIQFGRVGFEADVIVIFFNSRCRALEQVKNIRDCAEMLHHQNVMIPAEGEGRYPYVKGGISISDDSLFVIDGDQVNSRQHRMLLNVCLVFVHLRWPFSRWLFLKNAVLCEH
jgi:hypothetical protein